MDLAATPVSLELATLDPSLTPLRDEVFSVKDIIKTEILWTIAVPFNVFPTTTFEKKNALAITERGGSSFGVNLHLLSKYSKTCLK